MWVLLSAGYLLAHEYLIIILSLGHFYVFLWVLHHTFTVDGPTVTLGMKTLVARQLLQNTASSV